MCFWCSCLSLNKLRHCGWDEKKRLEVVLSRSRHDSRRHEKKCCPWSPYDPDLSHLSKVIVNHKSPLVGWLHIFNMFKPYLKCLNLVQNSAHHQPRSSHGPLSPYVSMPWPAWRGACPRVLLVRQPVQVWLGNPLEMEVSWSFEQMLVSVSYSDQTNGIQWRSYDRTEHAVGPFCSCNSHCWQVRWGQRGGRRTSTYHRGKAQPSARRDHCSSSMPRKRRDFAALGSWAPLIPFAARASCTRRRRPSATSGVSTTFCLCSICRSINGVRSVRPEFQGHHLESGKVDTAQPQTAIGNAVHCSCRGPCSCSADPERVSYPCRNEWRQAALVVLGEACGRGSQSSYQRSEGKLT